MLDLKAWNGYLFYRGRERGKPGLDFSYESHVIHLTLLWTNYRVNTYYMYNSSIQTNGLTMIFRLALKTWKNVGEGSKSHKNRIKYLKSKKRKSRKNDNGKSNNTSDFHASYRRRNSLHGCGPNLSSVYKRVHRPHLGTNIPLRDSTPNKLDLGFTAFGLKATAHKWRTPSSTSFPDSVGGDRKVWEPSRIQDLVRLHPWLTNFHLGTVCVLHIRLNSVLDLVWRSWCS
jgi:hypothetical protein